MSNAYGFAEVEPEFLAIMSSTVRLYQFTGRNEYGMETYSTTMVEVPCHMEDRNEDLTTATGEVRPVSGKVYLGWVVPWLSTNDRIDVPQLSSATGWQTAMIAAVIARYDQNGVHHQEVYFGERGETGRGQGA